MPSGVSRGDVYDLRHRDWHLPVEGELVTICGEYRAIMADPRHGSAGLWPYIDPGEAPLLTVKTFWYDEQTPIAELLLPNGTIRTFECIHIRPYDGSEVNYGIQT